MPIAAILEAILPELLQLGIQEAPVIQAYIAGLNKLQDPARPDVDDDTRAAIRQLIVSLQEKIDQA